MFYAIGNIGDSKKEDKTRLTDPDDLYECILEVMDNTLPLSTMPTGKVDEKGYPVYPIDESEWIEGNSAYDALQAELFDESKAVDKDNGLADTYGWRYIYEDGTDEQNAEVRVFVENKWREFYKFIVTSTNEEFKAHLGDWCVLDSVMYYYLFTLRYTMTDNHAKNSFWHYGKSNDVDSEGNKIRKWDLCFDYDNDTALGIDNYGRMTYRYGYEEIDYVDGTSDWVWNAPMHVFFLRLRELFVDELCTLYNKLEGEGAWSSTGLIKQFNDWQMQFPEELWRLDIERKYIRTYTTSFINGAAKPEFLKERANGRKKTQRSQFERNQEKYMSSKFGGTVASGDDIILRCSVPNTNLVVPANFNITLTPYAHMYLAVKYNTSPPERVRVSPGETYTFEYTADLADIIEIYSASCLKSLGDLSPCYLINADFSNAIKIRELILGNETEGYNNTNAITLGFGSNDLLNKLDVQNMSGLTSELDLSGLRNLEEFYGFGSNISGLVFADGGNLTIAEIPSVGSLSMKNLSLLTDDGFEATSYNNLTKFVAENSQLDLIDLINNADNLYQIRLIGIDWSLDDTTILQRLYNLAGVSNTGGNLDASVLSGKVHVPVIKERDLYLYNELWNDLEITYTTFIPQFAATFVNTDGSIVDVQYIDKGYMPVDPTTRAENPIATPIQESTVDKVFTFTGWDKEFVAMHEPMTFTAVYSSSTREYTIKYVSEFEGNPLQITTAPYGSIVEYEHEIPTYTALEGQSGGYRYYLFNRWDQSGYVNGDKTINAVFDHCDYTGSGYFEGREFSDLRPVEKYMMLKLNAAGDIDISKYVDVLDELTFEMGEDYDFDEIESKILIQNGTYLDTETRAVFTGSNYIDTGIQLMSEDRSFVLAVDFEFDTGNSTDATLMECYDANQSEGFKLVYNGTGSFKWSSNITPVSDVSNREMLVIRHVEGESDIHVYKSNFAGDYVEYTLVANGSRDYFTPITRNLVFGCSINLMGKPVSYASGSIHWAKVWYGDLGHNICSDIAKFTKEQISTQMCGYDRKILADGSGYGALSFLATHVLRHKSMMIDDGGTAGGWNATVAKQWLNTRFYNGLPLWVKQLIKPVKVEYLIGGGSTATSSCDCYVFLPSVTSLTNNSPYSSEPYTNEEKAIYGDKCISYMTSPEDRVRTNHLGEAVEYWTRSVYVNNQTYFAKVVPLRANGDIYAFTTSGTELSLVIEFCM